MWLLLFVVVLYIKANKVRIFFFLNTTKCDGCHLWLSYWSRLTRWGKKNSILQSVSVVLKIKASKVGGGKKYYKVWLLSFVVIMQIKANKVAWHPEVATQLCLSSGDDHTPVIQLWDLRFATSPLTTLENHQRLEELIFCEKILCAW